MTEFEGAETVVAAFRGAPDSDGPTGDELDELREGLAAGLRDAVDGWVDRPAGWLRVNKARMRATVQCPAQVLAEQKSYELDSALVLGTICDVAAGIVALHPGFGPPEGWYGALEATLEQEHPRVVEFVRALGTDDRAMLEADADQRCGALPELLGDLRAERITVREPVTVRFDDSRVALAAEIDLTLGARRRLLVEVKSGSFGLSIPDELRHYGLLVALRDGTGPAGACAVALRDGRVTPIPLRLDDLQTAARRVVATAEQLVEIDRRVASGRPVPTAPGGYCRWCRRVRECDAVDERVLAELPAPARNPVVDIDDPSEVDE